MRINTITHLFAPCLLLLITINISAQRINFQTIKGHMIANVSVFDSIEAKAFMDSGCPTCIIDYSIAQRAKVRLDTCSYSMFFLDFNKAIECKHKLLDTLTINGLRCTSAVYVADLSKLPQSDVSSISPKVIMGNKLIGKDGSRMLTLQLGKGYIEYGQKTLSDKYTPIQMEVIPDKNFASIESLLALEDNNGKQASLVGRFVIDTGFAGDYILFESEKVKFFIKYFKLNIKQISYNGRKHSYIPISSTTFLNKTSYKQSIRFKETTLRNYDGTIGFGVLKNWEIILDYSNNTLYVKK